MPEGDSSGEPRRPTVAVVVVTWNSAAVLPGLLDSLDAGLDGVDWHLTVADNDSADDTVAVLRQAAPDATLVRTGRNAGYAAGINAALNDAAPHTAALILNPDIRLHAGCVARMLDLLDEAGGAGAETEKAPEGDRTGIVVPRIHDRSGALSLSLRREPTLLRTLGEAFVGRRAGRYPRWGETIAHEGAYRTATTADWATGAVLLISGTCMRACGPWDESFFLYSEETEYALRARDLGFRTRLAPTAVAVHLEGESRVSPRLWTLLILNKVRLYRRRHTLPAAAAFWAAVLLREASRAAIGNRPSRRATAALLRPARLRERPSAETV